MKSVEEIYREMLDCFAQRTGMRPAEGCDLAARLYAVVAQVYSLYVQAEWLGRQVLPQTAEGEFLDRHAQLRGIARKEAAPATGVIRFTAGETADAARTILDRALGKAGGAAPAEEIRVVLEGEAHRYAG